MAPNAHSPSLYSNVPVPSTADDLNALDLGSIPDPFTRFVAIRFAADGMIECTLRVARLSEIGDFDALSYAWGPPTPTNIIRLNGQTFEIRRNLWQALNAILKSPASAPSYLWVDAISIDQDNVRERNHQVQFMKQIFSKAQLVWVWLGRGSNNVHAAIQELTVHKPFRPDQTMLARLNKTSMGALRTLFSQPYWTRMWIVQEFVLARDMRFLYGDEHFSWNDFRFTMLYLDEGAVAIHCQSHKVPAVRESYQYIRNSPAFSIYRTRKLYKSWAGFDIFALVLQYQKQDCSDPRDKVFALLGVAHHSFGIRADYTISKEDLLKQMEMACPLRSKNGDRSRYNFTLLLADILGMKNQPTWWESVKSRFAPL